MSLNVLDKKYKDTLPGIVQELPFHLPNKEDGAALLPPTRSVKKPRKSGFKKNGLCANEDIQVKRWWLGKDLPNVLADTQEAREHCTRTILLDQRSRETQLQIILILEALAVQGSIADSQAPTTSNESQEIANVAEGTKSEKPRKGKDLDTLLDLQVDRLSIWQSMLLEDSKASEENKESAGKKTEIGAKREEKHNHLQSFCVEVVLPL